MNLENLLKTFAAANADELKIEPDVKPYLISNTGKTDLPETALTPPQISQLIFPLIPLEEKLRLSSLPQIMFRHTNEFGMFGVTVAKAITGLKISIKKINVPSVDLKNGASPEIALVAPPEKSEPAFRAGTEQTKPVAPPTLATPSAVTKFSDSSINIERSQPKPLLNAPSANSSVTVQPIDEANFVDLDIPLENPSQDSPVLSRAPQIPVSEVTSGESVLQQIKAPRDFLATISATEQNATTEQPKPKMPNPETRVSAAAKMDQLFYKMAEKKASDLHLSVSMPPMIRRDGKMAVLEEGTEKLTPEAMRDLLHSIMPEKNREEFERRHDTDFAYEIKGLARFRVNIFMDRKGMGGVCRIIPTKILTADQLGLSDAILDLCKLNKGLVVVTGPTGSGKSTTLCAMIDYVNKNRTDHIITIEDPIEFVHENQKCLLNQREVHNHTDSFKDALRAALREDPDILLVGEMRDLETIAIAIETAETGHLVFGTLHTTTAPSTVDRIIDQFPADRQQQIRVMLSESLKGVIAQTLLPKKGGGRVAALEILIVTPAISNLIREGKTFQIASAMQTGKQNGMVVLNDALVELVKKGEVEPHDAYTKAVDKSGLESLFKRHGIG